MRIFDSGSVPMRTYLHLSYALSMTMLALIARQTVDVVYGHADSLNLLSKEFLISLAAGTLLVSAMLYLHLPKMINRCFTIGRHFGL
jgi:flagellar biosynthesis protein FliR